eukprot:GSA25T00011924001.1
MAVVIHQPARDAYRLFDDLILLNRGKLIYSGPREGCGQTLREMRQSIKQRSKRKQSEAREKQKQTAEEIRRKMMLRRRRSTKNLGSAADILEFEAEEVAARQRERAARRSSLTLAGTTKVNSSSGVGG